MALAKAALNRLQSQTGSMEPCIKIQGDTIEYFRRDNPQNVYRFGERFDLDKDEVIDFTKIQFTSIKESNALRTYLKSKGFVRIARKVFAKNTASLLVETF